MHWVRARISYMVEAEGKSDLFMITGGPFLLLFSKHFLICTALKGTLVYCSTSPGVFLPFFYRNFTQTIHHRKRVGTLAMTSRCEFFITHQVSLCVLWQCRRSQEDKKSLFDIIPMDPTRRRLEGLKFVYFYARRQIIEKSHWAVSFGSLPGCSLSHSQWSTKVHRVRNDLQFHSGGLWSFWTCQLKCQLSASNVPTCSLEHYANWPD